MKKKIIITILFLLLTTLISCKCLCSDLFHENGYFKLLPMTVEPRQGHTATLLQDGRVLITGGGFGTKISKTAEIYDSKTNKFTKTGDMTTPRTGHASILLQDGRVLVTGGNIQGKNVLEDLRSAETYNPKTGKFTKIDDMNHAWFSHKMILLHDGRVLLCSNISNLEINSKLEIFDSNINTFKELPPCLTTYCPQNATLLNDGTILLASGLSLDNRTQLFNPKTETFEATGKMSFYRSFSTATLLNNGEVVIIGGTSRGRKQGYSGQSEIYNPQTGTFRVATKLMPSRYLHSSILLNNSKILVVGGYTGQDESLRKIKNAELYDPQIDKFIKIPDMHYPRLNPTVTLLKNGNVLIISNGKRPELYVSK